MKKITRILKIFLLLCISLSFCYFLLCTAVFLYSFQNYDGTADSAIVLGAAQWNGKPSPVLKERINHAIKLYQQNRIKNIIFTGGYGIKSKFSEAEVSKRYALINGIPEKNIFVETLSTSTIENIKYAKLIAKKNNFKTLILVSDPYHMLRSKIISIHYGLNCKVSPTLTSKSRDLVSMLIHSYYEAFYILRMELLFWLFY